MITTKRKQQMLDNFIQRVNGKGQATSVVTIRDMFGEKIKQPCCMYVKKNHPGCAIGCQPEFEPFKDEIKKLKFTQKIVSLFSIAKNNLGDRIQKAFYVASTRTVRMRDDSFLTQLQYLHDMDENWKGKKIRKRSVAEFCTQFSLTVPESKYA